MFAAHRRMSSSKAHSVIAITDLPAATAKAPAATTLSPSAAAVSQATLCTTHGKSLELFDFQCRRLLCAHCVIEHANHQLRPVSEAAPMCHAELDEWLLRLSRWQERIELANEMVDQRREEILTQHARMADMIQESFDLVKASADRRCQALLEQLHVACEDKLNRAHMQGVKWQTLQDRTNEVLTAVQAARLPTTMPSNGIPLEIRSLIAYQNLVPFENMSVPVLVADQSELVLTIDSSLPSSQFQAFVDTSAAERIVSDIGTVSTDGSSIEGRFMRRLELSIRNQIAFTHDGQFYLGHNAMRVGGKATIKVCSTSDHSVIRTFGGDQLIDPACVALSPDNLVLVADHDPHCIFVFHTDGRLVRRIGSEGPSLGCFKQPRGMCVSTDSLLFVADKENHRVQVFNLTSGVLLFAFGSKGSEEGQFIQPMSVCLSPDESQLFVADSMNHRIQVFDQHGNFLRQWGSKGSGPGQLMHPQAVLVTARGDVLVADRDNHRVNVYSAEGVFAYEFGGSNSDSGQLQLPFAMSLSPSNELYVCSASRTCAYSVFS
jgi:DNA-binding beta-propeller fold protein YncE